MTRLILALALLGACVTGDNELVEPTAKQVCGPAPTPPYAGLVQFDNTHAILYRADYVVLAVYRDNVAQWAECRESFDD